MVETPKIVGVSPGEDVSVARKLCTLTVQNQNYSCLFRQDDHMNKGHKPDKIVGSSLGENVFRDHLCL